MLFVCIVILGWVTLTCLWRSVKQEIAEAENEGFSGSQGNSADYSLPDHQKDLHLQSFNKTGRDPAKTKKKWLLKSDWPAEAAKNCHSMM